MSSHLALSFPLHGSQLIEASAGTGKTFTISALYVRLVLQHASPFRPLTPPEILVVTFTDAATLELRDRIRRRLVEALQVFRGEREGDALLRALRDDFPEEAWPACAYRLEVAAQWMDEAAVSTIHGWCQRMLREHAFDSGSLFEQVVNTQQQALQAHVVRDYWRQQCYPLTGKHLQWVEQHWKNPEHLGSLLNKKWDMPLAAPTVSLAQALDDMLRPPLEALAELKVLWRTRHLETMRNLFRAGSDAKWFGANKVSEKIYLPRLSVLQAWCDADDSVFLPVTDSDAFTDYFKRFTKDGLEAALSAAGKKIPAERIFSADVLAALDSMQQVFTQHAALMLLADGALRHALAWVRVRFDEEKRHRAEIDFDDMLTRLDAALQGDNGEQLAAVIRRQFPVAMIDEFQDTDAVQYRIFDRVYGIQGNPQNAGLFLIGDPKQAIYRFRGADIHTYLQARMATQGRHHPLQTNYRSTPELVEAVNRVFGHAEAQPSGAGAFLFRQAEHNPLPFHPVEASARAARTLRIADDPQAALTFWALSDSGLTSAKEYTREMSQRCASYIVHLLSLSQQGQAHFVEPDGSTSPLHAGDIAVLVRTSREAAQIRSALSARGVRSVYLSDRDSVLESPEAHDVLLWLRACAEPESERHVRAALASRTLGLSLSALEHLSQDETHWEEWVMQFRDYRRLWWQQGVLPMLHRFFHDVQLPQALKTRADGERVLTNLLHIAELLQQDAMTLDGEQALIRHFSERLAESDEASSGDKLIRLESDERLVQVVTIHKSKGLEYPLVFLPFLCTSRQVQAGGYVWLHKDGRRQCVLLKKDSDDLQLAEQERLREDMRLLYVALTRAQQACWVGIANLTPKSTTKDSTLHLSALGRLLGGGDVLPATGSVRDWLAPVLKTAVCAVDAAPADTRQNLEVHETTPAFVCRQTMRRAAEHWWIASYSALLLDAGKTVISVARSDDTSPERAAVQRLTDDDFNAPLPAPGPMESGLLSFPRGPVQGVFLHGLLEMVGREGFAASAAKPEWLRRQVERRCERRGLSDWHGRLSEWLLERLSHPLPLGEGRSVALTALRGYQVEMEFSFHVQKARLKQIDALVCTHLLPGLARSPLAEETLNGLFKGFIDLAFEHEGRYYVADYKSNGLGMDESAYQGAALDQALMKHRYDLQGLFYLIALHRQLQVRLPDYDYERHMGGVLFLFLRGSGAEGQGVWVHRPERAFIETLDALLQGHTLAVEQERSA